MQAQQRSAAYYAAWRAVTASVRGLFETLRRFRRERETYHNLSRLSDRMLQDIGISRSEIGSVAQAAAVAPPEAGLTIAELRRIPQTTPAGRNARVAPPHRVDQRRGRSGYRVAPQSAAAA